MKNQIDKLEMMANQIAQFFKGYPHDEAVVGVGTHIQAFWTPKMIATLKAEINHRPKLDPLVIEAFTPPIGGA